MEDPESGRKPFDIGALAADGSDPRGSSRRGRRRRRRGHSAQVQSAPATSAGLDDPAQRPIPESRPGKPRKRKRRRGRGSAPGPLPQGETSVVASAAPKPETPAPSEAPAGRKGHRSRKSRGPQGRPLQASGQKKAEAKPSHHPKADSQTAAQQGPAPNEQPPINGHRANDAPPPRERHYHDGFYAALDLGTNNCRLLIAQPTRPGQFRVVDAFSRIVRLGEGLGASGRLSVDAMDRAVEALRICAAKLKSREIRRMRLIATEACRSADNGAEFLARVTAETGLDLEVINRETEARLAVSGCSSLIGHDARSAVLFDIGGGSSEIAVRHIGYRRSPRLANHITHWTSLPVGVVTLSERHGGRDVTPAVFEAMINEVEGMLDRFESPPVSVLKAHRPAPDGGSRFHLIGTSGTVTTLAGVYLNLPRYDRRQVDGLWLSDADVSDMQAKLLSLGFDERAANPCIGPDRADLVLAGCAILEAIRRRWPSDRMRVADRGLREGLLTDMMADDGVWSRNSLRRPPFAGPRN